MCSKVDVETLYSCYMVEDLSPASLLRSCVLSKANSIFLQQTALAADSRTRLTTAELLFGNMLSISLPACWTSLAYPKQRLWDIRWADCGPSCSRWPNRSV